MKRALLAAGASAATLAALLALGAGGTREALHAIDHGGTREAFDGFAAIEAIDGGGTRAAFDAIDGARRALPRASATRAGRARSLAPRGSPSEAVQSVAQAGLRSDRLESGSPPGVPPRTGAVTDRSWRALAWRAIAGGAHPVAGGVVEEARRERLLTALVALRDTAPAGAEGGDGAAARQRQRREAALRADRVFRDELGVPLGRFLEANEPGGVEEVELGIQLTRSGVDGVALAVEDHSPAVERAAPASEEVPPG